MTNEAKIHFLEEQLKNYRTKRYRLEVEMEIIGKAFDKMGDDYISKKEMDAKEEAVDNQFKELDVAIEVCEARIAELS